MVLFTFQTLHPLSSPSGDLATYSGILCEIIISANNLRIDDNTLYNHTVQLLERIFIKVVKSLSLDYLINSYIMRYYDFTEYASKLATIWNSINTIHISKSIRYQVPF